jgi:mono/diheme cytochrome c family protein
MSLQDKSTLIQTVFKRIWVFVIGTVLVVALILAWPFLWNNGSVKYADINEHFKYGSIGGEQVNGIPYWVWKVLPVVFRDKLPGQGYTSFGFIQEPGKDLPIGFAQSKIGVERVGQNCATCHAGTLRETPDSQPQVINTMPSNTVNLGAYIKFLSDVAIDERFNASEMMPQIEAMGAKFNPLEKLVYRYFVIPQTRDALSVLGSKFAFMDSQSDYGPGRVDTFSGYKTRQFNFPVEKLSKDELNGIADFPSIWQQRPRQGMQLHWDGNNDSVDERNNSAALALVTPTTINFEAIHRIKDWLLDIPAPRYPYAVNEELAAVGKPIFENTCASCHAFGGSQVGKVVPIEEIGTDRGRLDSYTYETLSNQNTLFTDISYQGVDQRFHHFRKTDGYANMPLDGIWLRSPYLHNGSVPTLRDLLEVPSKRPKVFYRGYDVFDQKNVGFVSNLASEGNKQYFKFDTTLPGNSNSGHLYGTELSPEQKEALVEYMKQL